jgi:dTDP-4-dehydrorhamnose reductase
VFELRFDSEVSKVKIGVTGARGRIGEKLIERLKEEHQVVTFGRSNSDFPWTMGVIPAPDLLKDVDAFIHLAWSLRDRVRDYHLNVGGTLLLAQAARNSKIPFLFVSSLAATSSSEYGKSKAAAEKLVLEELGDVIRFGLVPEFNGYTNSKVKPVAFYISSPKQIEITRFELICTSIEDWIKSAKNELSASSIITVLSGALSSKHLFAKKARLAVPVPLVTIRLFLLASKPFSLRARNLYDALKTITTIGTIHDEV